MERSQLLHLKEWQFSLRRDSDECARARLALDVSEPAYLRFNECDSGLLLFLDVLDKGKLAIDISHYDFSFAHELHAVEVHVGRHSRDGLVLVGAEHLQLIVEHDRI